MMIRNVYLTGSWCRKVVLTAFITFGVLSCDGPSAPDVPTVSLADKSTPKVVSATEAIRTPVITKLDPATLDGAEIDKVLSEGPRCTFRYTAASPPILASTSVNAGSNAEGVIKINGRLVKLSSSKPTSWPELASGAVLTNESIRVEILPESNEDPANERAATMHFKIQPEFHAGYKGWYRCDNQSAIASLHY